jgi:hypothetical protein
MLNLEQFVTEQAPVFETVFGSCRGTKAKSLPPSSPAASSVINLRLATQVWHGHDGPRCPMPPDRNRCGLTDGSRR